MKVRYNGPTDEFIFVDGRVYEAKLMLLYSETYGVIDEDGDCSPMEKSEATIVEGSEEDLDWYDWDPNDPNKEILVHKGKSSK